MSNDNTPDLHKPPAHEIKTDREKLARALSEILHNPQTPVAIYNSVGDLTLEICMPLLDYSPQIIEKALLRDGVSRVAGLKKGPQLQAAATEEPRHQKKSDTLGLVDGDWAQEAADLAAAISLIIKSPITPIRLRMDVGNFKNDITEPTDSAEEVEYALGFGRCGYSGCPGSEDPLNPCPGPDDSGAHVGEETKGASHAAN